MPHPPAQPAHWRLVLAAMATGVYLVRMILVFDQTDRARLGERFFGATHTVLARL